MGRERRAGNLLTKWDGHNKDKKKIKIIIIIILKSIVKSGRENQIKKFKITCKIRNLLWSRSIPWLRSKAPTSLNVAFLPLIWQAEELSLLAVLETQNLLLGMTSQSSPSWLRGGGAEDTEELRGEQSRRNSNSSTHQMIILITVTNPLSVGRKTPYLRNN